MAKFKNVSQGKQTSAVKSTKTSIVKKRKTKKKDNKVSLNSIHKNLKKLSTSNEITKNTYPNKQSNKKEKQHTKNKFGTKDTEKPDVSTRYRKDDKKNSKVFQEIQINTNNKTKQKLKSKNGLHVKDTNSKTKQKIKNKNRHNAKDTKRLDVPTKYLKENNKTSDVLQKAIDTNNKKRKRKRSRKRKQNMNLNQANNSAVTINDTKERNKKLQVSAKNLEFERKKTKIEKLKKINEKKIKRTSAQAQQVKSDNMSKLNKHKINIKQLEKMLPSKSQLKSKVQPKINEKKIKRTSVKVETQQVKSNNMSKLNKRKINIKQSEKMLPSKSQLKPKVQPKINEKKIKRTSVEVEAQQMKSNKMSKLNKRKINIKQSEKILPSKSQLKSKVQPTLRDRMITQLRASRFRFINEILYNNNSSQSKHYFKTDPDAFMAYHVGYKQQLEQWAVNPLDVIISSIKKLPKDNIIADFGCGEARLAASVPHTVHSFDFIALNDKVKACDMAHTPLLMNSVHVVVFCLSLMGSNLDDYIIEANRILKNNGILKIAEVASRFENVKDFIKLLYSYGFKNTWEDLSHNLFYFMDFRKGEDIKKRKNLPSITLKSCLYKKR